MAEPIKGFSKLSKEAKIEWMIREFFDGNEEILDRLKSYWHIDPKVQKLHDEFIENTISNFYTPFGVAPNFLINGVMHCIPMAIEESSVVAAAAKSATFWLDKGGFRTEVLSTTKIGHVHFTWSGDNKSELVDFFNRIKPVLLEGTEHLTRNMRMRGGGIIDVELVDKTEAEPDYYQLHATFNTCDSMGANFINSILEEFSTIMKREAATDDVIDSDELNVIMCILSNYTPDCIVRAEVKCKVSELTEGTGISGEEFVKKFTQGIRIATIEPYRATTHNKGIMNGVDAVVMATGNDFRAVEACAHTYAARDGQYRSLTQVEVVDGVFRFWIDLPMSLGTVGGLTKLHPMVKLAHALLGNPNAEELMQITAAAGLAQNFAAIRSLVTTGIQQGHMKMHLLNILNQLGATMDERKQIKKHFADKVVSHSDVVRVFCEMRGIEQPDEQVNK